MSWLSRVLLERVGELMRENSLRERGSKNGKQAKVNVETQRGRAKDGDRKTEDRRNG
jgi:hypothetical protein